MTQEALKLALEALEQTLQTLDDENAKPGGAIADTIWHSEHETLFDYLGSEITAIKEVLAEHAMQEVQRLGQEIEQELKIKTTDPFESSRVADYNRGWNDCLFASGIVKQPEQEPVAQVLRKALAWGKVYGAVLSGEQWDEMREEMVAQFSIRITTPPQRKPLNWEPIQEFWRNNSNIDWDELESAIKQAAHGIKENT
jgi:hypothetical protein